MANKKDIESFKTNINSLSKSIENITNNVDGINSQVENYNEEINDIKNNVRSLENELKTFIDEMKAAPLIEKAKEEIKNDTNELFKKYSKLNQIRERILELVNNKEVLTKEEQSSFNLPNFYLTYILFAINAEIKGDQKALNNAVNQANKLNKNNTSLILTLVYIKFNKIKEALKYLEEFLLTINPKEISKKTVLILENLSHYKAFYNKINEFFNKWTNELNKNKDIVDMINNKVKEEINILNIKLNSDETKYLKEYCLDYDKLIDEYNSLSKYGELYDIVNDYGENKNIDLLEQVINIKEEKELQLEQNIAKNEAFLLNKEYSEVDNHSKKTDIYSIMINVLFNKNNEYNLKHFSLHYLKDYLLKNIDPKKEEKETILLEINNLALEVNKKHSREEITEKMINYISEPFKKGAEKYKLFSSKTIYSLAFSIIGIIVALFNSSIGITMFVIGLLMLTYFIVESNTARKEIDTLYNETIESYKEELNYTLDEVEKIFELNQKNKAKKEELINIIASS